MWIFSHHEQGTRLRLPTWVTDPSISRVTANTCPDIDKQNPGYPRPVFLASKLTRFLTWKIPHPWAVSLGMPRSGIRTVARRETPDPEIPQSITMADERACWRQSRFLTALLWTVSFIFIPRCPLIAMFSTMRWCSKQTVLPEGWKESPTILGNPYKFRMRKNPGSSACGLRLQKSHSSHRYL